MTIYLPLYRVAPDVLDVYREATSLPEPEGATELKVRRAIEAIEDT